jgi:hypothetical protein
MSLTDRINAIPRDAIERLTKIVTHAGCPDGIASAMILHRAFPELPVEFIYHGTPEHNQAPCAALFCDFSPPAERADAWREAGAIVIDHHATARGVVESFADCGVFADEAANPGVSGAFLAFLLASSVCGSMVPLSDPQGLGWAWAQFAEVVGIRDTWRRAHVSKETWERACALASTLTFYGAEHWLKVGTLPNRDELLVGSMLHARRVAKARELGLALPRHYAGSIGFALFNDSTEKLTSDVGEAARELGRPLDFVAGFFFSETGQLVFSLRSVADGFDVGALAKANGGGGHTKAAGFQCEEGFVDAPIEALRRAIARGE